ncbi:MAG: hypothetical protein Tp118DCM00d2C30442581_10 [Prokaryotic dsDNA virus sp.]|nr:MAG: hypothetical protein Tp118DCM00d2C30442581_10 [Prokaryotic dsDNA virus sp.]|tara:strand:+ start:11375 stop:11602 length:228 start_codon:yes stop_codon:yes gene_type:complete
MENEYGFIEYPEETTYWVAYNDTSDWTCGHVTIFEDMASPKNILLENTDAQELTDYANQLGIPVTYEQLLGDGNA